MKELKRNIIFLDANGNRARLKIEITKRNGYPEFTMTGDFLGGCGQVMDHIVPANDKQRELIELWKKYHLKGISNGFNKIIVEIMDSIEKLEKEKEENKEVKTGDDAILENMVSEGIDEKNLEAVKAYLALGIDGDDLINFKEAYSGEFSSNEDFAKEQAENMGVEVGREWPCYCIDWEYAARELMMDYSEHDGYYFRNI